MQLGGTTIRVACNQAATSDFVNATSGRAPVIPKAGSVSIPCAVFTGDPSVEANLETDLGNVVTADCIIRAGTASGAVLFQQVIQAAAFTPALTYDQWTAGTGAHFTFSLSPTDSNLPPGALWIAIGVTTTNAGNVSLVYCGTAQLKDYGIFNAAAPTAPDYTSWSKAEADARYATVAAILNVFGGFFSVANPVTGTVFPVLLSGADAAPQITVLPPGTYARAIALSAMVAGLSLVQNRTTGSVFPLVVTGPDAAPTLAVLPPGSVLPATTYAVDATGRISLCNLTTGTFFRLSIVGTDANPELALSAAS